MTTDPETAEIELGTIPDPGACEVVFESLEWPVAGFLVRKAGRVYGYVNVCPHAGRMLNWGPDKFLTRDKALIICSAHGAVFEIETGICVAGPCPGASLRPLDVEIKGGVVRVRYKKLGSESNF